MKQIVIIIIIIISFIIYIIILSAFKLPLTILHQYWEFHFLQLVVPENTMEQGITASVSLQYFLNRDERNAKDRYVWLFGGWSFCSVSCGGGTRQKMIVCKDEKTGRIVSRRKCPLTTKPSQEIEKCNVFRYYDTLMVHYTLDLLCIRVKSMQNTHEVQNYMRYNCAIYEI